jgi:UPF0755 protein
MKKRFLGISGIFFIFLSIIVLSALVVYLNVFMPNSAVDNWKEVRIPDGATYSQGIGILKKQGIIRNELALIALGRLTMTDRKLRAGYYNLNSAMSSWDVFSRLRKGMIIQYFVTIPEGFTLDDIKIKLKARGLINNDSWQLVNNRDFLSSLNIEAPSLEGYIYPDTYNLAKGADTADVFRIMVQRLRENFDQSLRERAKELGMSENDVLTLASIIEKEAMIDEERPIISAVYSNRLKKKMRLQADPTVIYGIHSCLRCITKSDLKRKTPYNTYVIEGLPPGPIASPGIKSIKAALYPAQVNYLYFVSKNDGTHYFSKTGEEHVAAVMLYRQKNNASTTPLIENKPENAEEKTN